MDMYEDRYPRLLEIKTSKDQLDKLANKKDWIIPSIYDIDYLISINKLSPVKEDTYVWVSNLPKDVLTEEDKKYGVKLAMVYNLTTQLCHTINVNHMNRCLVLKKKR